MRDRVRGAGARRRPAWWLAGSCAVVLGVSGWPRAGTAGSFTAHQNGGWREILFCTNWGCFYKVWSTTNVYPQAGDTVTINAYDATLGTDESCANLNLSQADLRINAHTFLLTGSGSFSTSSITGDLSSHFVNNGAVTADQLDFLGVDALSGFTYDNYDTTLHVGHTNFFLSQTIFSNHVGGVYELQGNGFWTYYAGGIGRAEFANHGTLRKTGGAGTSTIARFRNHGGIVQCSSGVLQLRENGIGASLDGTLLVGGNAILDLTGGETCRYNGTYTGGGQGTIRVASGDMQCGANGVPAVLNIADSVFCLQGGWISGLLAIQGTFRWQGGEFHNTVVTNLTTLVVEGPGEKKVSNFYYDTRFVNRGTVRQTDGLINVEGGGTGGTTWNNLAGSVYDIAVDGWVMTNYYGGAFNNYGTLRKSAGTGTSIVYGTHFHNYNATVDVQVGTVSLRTSGNLAGGQFKVASGAALDFPGGLSPTLSGVFTDGGAGIVRLAAGSLRCAQAVLNLTNGLRWAGGEVFHDNYSGSVTNLGLVVLEGSGAKTVRSFWGKVTFANRGTVRQSGSGAFHIQTETGGDTRFENHPDGLFDLAADGTNLTGNAPFQNYGVFVKSARGGVSTVLCPVYNYGGTVEARAGVLSLSSYVHTAGVIRVNGGALSLPGFTLQAGRIEGAGAVTVGDTLTSQGVVSPGYSAGMLTINGNYGQGAGGSLDIELGGVAPGSGHDQLRVSGSASLGGTLRAWHTNGFSAAFGQSFTVLVCAARSGLFAATNLPALGGGLVWRVAYGASDVVLEPAGAIHLQTDSVSAAESGGPVQIAVVRDGPLTAAAGVSFATADGTAYAGRDYLSTNGWVVFPVGVGTGTIAVTVLDNPFDDLDERTFQVALGSVTGAVVLAPPWAAQVTVADDEGRRVAAFPFSDSFDGAASNCWALYMGAAGRILVTASNGPADSWHVTMDSAADTVYALNEAVLNIDLSGQTNAWLRFWHKSLNDDDHPLAVSFAGHANGDGVSISGDGTNWCRLASLVSGEGTRGAYRDFTYPLNPVLSSNGLSPSASARIKFQQYDNYGIPSDGFAFDRVAVFAPLGVIALTTNAQSASEAAGSVTVTVVRTGSGIGTASVEYYTTDGSAHAGMDYTEATGVLVFAEGIRTNRFVVPILDNAYENLSPRAFSVVATNLWGFYLPAAPSAQTVTLLDNDAPAAAPLPFVETFESGVLSNYWSLWSTSGAVTRVATDQEPRGAQHLLTDPGAGAVFGLSEAILNVNLGGQTDVWLSCWHKEFSDDDHPMPAAFAGHTNADGIAISTNGVNWYRAYELTATSGISAVYQQHFVPLTAVGSSNGLLPGGTWRVKFQNYDNSAIPSDGFAFDDIRVFRLGGIARFSTNACSAGESGVAVTVRVERTGGNTGAVWVAYATADGTARAGADFAEATGILNLAVGQLSGTIPVSLTDDLLAEPVEVFAVELTDFANAIPGSPTRCEVRIADDEAAMAVLSESFEAGLPGGWTVATGGDTNATWRFNDPGGRGNLTGATGAFAIADSDYFCSYNMDAELRLPPLGFTGRLPHIEFKTDYYHWEDQAADVDVSIHGAAGPWINVWRKTSNHRGPATVRLDLSAPAGNQTNVMIRFRLYNATCDWWWEVDDVVVYAEADADSDGLPNWWEQRYFGSITGGTASGHADNDGVPNDAELDAGTDPTNTQSFLEIAAMAGADRISMAYPTVAEHLYSLQGTTNLRAGAWNIMLSDVEGTGTDQWIINLDQGPAYQYRIEVRRP